MANFKSTVRLLDRSLRWAEAELGHAPPAGFEWAKKSLSKLACEAKPVRTHLPEMADAFFAQNGECAIAEGGVNTVRKAFGVEEVTDEAVAAALPYRQEGVRRNLLIFHHQRYPTSDVSYSGNILAHELGHIGDVARNNSDLTRVMLGSGIIAPHMGRHSDSRLFRLCYNVEATLKPSGFAAKFSNLLKNSRYKPEEYWEEQFAHSIGHGVVQGVDAPLVNHYIRAIFKPDMAWKAQGYNALRAGADSALIAPYPKIVGEELEPLFTRWRHAGEALEQCKGHWPHAHRAIGQLEHQYEAVAQQMRASAPEIRASIGKHMDNLMPAVEQNYERFRSKSLPYGR